ncbi:MAG: hypothetical protein F6K19_14770 [Cyanothece sp. SIO1E1]|nr:hypothetical protein [Cyanothece sp. SIO1E1]
MARYALVIGIATYNTFRNLPKATADAEAVAQILEQYGNFYKVDRLPKRWIEGQNRYEIAPDKQVTADQLFNVLQTFVQEAKNQEALIYFAGHGFRVSSRAGKQRGLLATSNSIADGRKAIALDDDFNELLNQSNLSSLVVLLDCCHAGTLLESNLELNRNLIEPSLSVFNAPRDYYLITACRAGELAREEGEHGVFTGAILQGLAQANANPTTGRVSVNRLFDFVYQQLQGSGQEPFQLGGGRSLTIVTYPTQIEVKSEIDESICPYRGLKPFEKEHAAFFFGRRQVVEDVWKKLELGNFVAVIGTSGSGKSSSVQAGLIPWLQTGGWQILDPIKPGDEPLTELRAAFKSAFQSSPDILQQLGSLIRQAPEGLQSLIEQLPGTGKFLLVVDQFEEVFTICSNEIERSRFIYLITQATEMPNTRLAVVITMRADFLEPCLQYEFLTHLIQTQAVFIPPLRGANLGEAIVKPAEVQGYKLEPGLLEEILQDVGSKPGMLPLLQFTLAELWERRDRNQNLLLRKHYEDMGRVFGALNRHAEKVYRYQDYQALSPRRERTPQQKEWIRRVLLRLVRTNESEKDTRQRQPRENLLGIAENELNEQQALNQIIDQLINAGLLVSAEGLPQLRESEAEKLVDLAQTIKTIDLAHESLIDGWQRFAEDWLKESRQLRRLRDKLEDALQEWEREGRQNENLMMGGLLTQMQENWQELELEIGITATEFYQRSYANERRRNLTLLQGIEATIERQATEVRGLLSAKSPDALVFAIQLIGNNLNNLPERILRTVQLNLHEALIVAREQNILGMEQDALTSVAFSPSDQHIASGSDDGTVSLWDFQGNPIRAPFQGHEMAVRSVAFSPSGQYIVSGSDDGTVRLWEIGDWETWLQIACDRLRYHPVFKNPQTEAEKVACKTCQKYIWK